MTTITTTRPTYTEPQLQEYLERVNLPSLTSLSRIFEIEEDDDDIERKLERKLELLTALQRYQLAHVPFENLALHYSPHRTISLDASDLYEKIVGRRRGGYCMENNCFFGAVLRGMGFRVCSAGARISHAVEGRGGGGYLGWSHMVNLVTLSNGKKYMVDVGFGAGPTRPLPLEVGTVWAGFQQMRLVHENISPNTDPEQRLWIYQSRNSDTDEWMDTYCFTELEFLPQDYEILNFFTSQNPKSWFTQEIVVVKFEMDDTEELVGMVKMLGAEVKRSRGEQTETLRSCKNEGERVTAFKTWFGVELDESEIRGIKGLVTELKG